MIQSGLVSVSFRNLSPDEILRLSISAKIDAIEWGGDVHIPHGNLQKANEIRQKTKDAGLEIAAYGSYYYAGISEGEGINFMSVLETAKEISSPTIRVWAGKKSSNDADVNYKEIVVSDLLRIGELSQKENITISLERHNNTLTDTNGSCISLLNRFQDTNVFFYWQPPPGMTVYNNIEGLNSVLQRVTNIHVYEWEYKNGKIIRRALSEGKHEWLKYFYLVNKSQRDHNALLEFFKDDEPGQFIKDAITLKSILNEVNS